MRILRRFAGVLPLLAGLAACESIQDFNRESECIRPGGCYDQARKHERDEQQKLSRSNRALQTKAASNEQVIQTNNERIDAATRTLASATSALQAAMDSAKLTERQRAELQRERNDIADELSALQLREKTERARRTSDAQAQEQKRLELERLQKRASALEQRVQALTKAAAGG